MSVRLNYSETYGAKRKRIGRLPELMAVAVRGLSKRNALLLMGYFRDGIRSGSFGLERLKPATVSRKEALGYERPESPLYGRGGDKSYSECLRLRRDGTRFAVGPSRGKHWSGVPLDLLFYVHENGATVRDGFGKGVQIRIAPRPAFRLSYERLMRRLEREDPAAEVRKACRDFVMEGQDRALRRMAQYEKRRAKEEE